MRKITKKQKIEYLKRSIRNIPDFPKKGIDFKDVTSLFLSDNLAILSELLLDEYKDKGITKVVGIEARGFIMGSIIALGLQASFVPIRKKNKLPLDVYEEKYKKEYGYDKIQIHKNAINADDVVLIHDDLLATGGTMYAAYNLIKKIGVKHIYINSIIELEDLKGKSRFPEEVIPHTLITFSK